MNLAKSPLFLSLLLLGFLFSPLYGDQLDVFQSGKPFPVEFFFKTDNWVRLEDLSKEQIGIILPVYLAFEKKEKKRAHRNLLNLAIGRLFLILGESGKAEKWLDKNIFGNFALEDYRLYFRFIALRNIAVKKLNEKKNITAVKAFRKSIQLLLRIHQSFPESPFMENLERDLAEVEFYLGKTYFQAMNYKAAWRSYRKSLMREFKDNLDHRLRTYLAIAKTYEAKGDIREAVDIYTLLLSRKYDERVIDAVDRFLMKFKSTIREKNISLNKMIFWRKSKLIHKNYGK